MSPRIVILTGAGISAESGLGTFRDLGGLWTQVRLEDVATPEAYQRDPDGVLAFYEARRANARAAEPNAAHRALARLQAARPGEVLIVTQNVDDLHERGGSPEGELIHMHGELMGALCAVCGHRWRWGAEAMTVESRCPACQANAVRPDVVWFGEMPYRMDDIFEALTGAELFVSIGTSGEVYPAAGLVAEARDLGIATLELNLEPSSGARLFDEARRGKATEVVPEWVEEVLAAG
ncbi:MAG: NAD-dependent deacylase [Pseudomonadota bacterium]